MKVLITGVAGFIASKIANKLIEKGHNVVGIDDLSNGKKINIPKKCKFIKLDISKKKELDKLQIKFDQIFHLAGQSSGEKSFENPEEDLCKNTLTTLNLIDFSIKTRVKKFLYASSQSVYGNVGNRAISEKNITQPLSCYGVSKLASENYLKVYKDYLNYIIFRINNVYGYGQDLKNLKQGMVSIYLAQALKNKKIVVKGSLNRFRDFVHIDDVVDIWIKAAMDKGLKNITLNLGTGKKTHVKKILNIINKEFGDIKIIKSNNTPGDQTGIYMNNNLLIKKLKKRYFININEGLSKLIKNYRNNKK